MMQECSTVKTPKAYRRKIETEIPLVTEADFEKRLMLVPLKAEKIQSHFAETLDPDKKIGCKNPYLSHDCLLMPVYNVEDEIIQILRVQSSYYPGSLRYELDRFYDRCDICYACHYLLPFSISSGKTWYDDDYSEDESGEVPLFRIAITLGPLNNKEMAAREKCVSRFLEEYRTGDLARAVDTHELANGLNVKLKLKNLAGYIRRIFSSPKIAKESAN